MVDDAGRRGEARGDGRRVREVGAHVGDDAAVGAARRAEAIEVRPEIEAASDREVQSRFPGTAWTRCDSWYRDSEAGGRIVANWPGYMREYLAATETVDPQQYALLEAPVAVGSPERPGV